ncbi:MAG: hypothetical protein H7Y43_15225 [Akkermansiaceae bacterium]|nr:hypothetical protein [Verrucomicrobiales bacterium]
MQKELGIDQDGKVGPQTWEAIYERVCGKKSGAGGGGGTPKPPPTAGEKVDDRSEQVIATIQPEVRPYARAVVMKARAAGITIQDEPHFSNFARSGQPEPLKKKCSPNCVRAKIRAGSSTLNHYVPSILTP